MQHCQTFSYWAFSRVGCGLLYLIGTMSSSLQRMFDLIPKKHSSACSCCTQHLLLLYSHCHIKKKKKKKVITFEGKRAKG